MLLVVWLGRLPELSDCGSAAQERDAASKTSSDGVKFFVDV